MNIIITIPSRGGAYEGDLLLLFLVSLLAFVLKRGSVMGKGNDLLHLLKTGNSGEARKLVAKLKKQGNLSGIYLANL